MPQSGKEDVYGPGIVNLTEHPGSASAHSRVIVVQQ
jgi:hypothetical protein